MAERDLRHLLDLDPDLAEGLDPRTTRVVRERAVASTVVLEVGECDLQTRWAGRSDLWGLLILEGLIARRVQVAGRTATELLGPGDLLRPWEHEELLFPCQIRWQAVARSRLAVLDQELAQRIRPWPEIAGVLLGRAIKRAHAASLDRAISSHKRLDAKIVMLFWHLAERWGRVGAEGSIQLSLPVTHRLIGELVGAERPSVSTALGRVSEAGLLDREGRRWILHGTVEDHLEFLTQDVEEWSELAGSKSPAT